MAKRYYTTEIFDDAWFMDLPNKYKLFWFFLLTKCNHSGIWQVNWKLAQFYIGDNLEPAEVKRIFRERIVDLENGSYWFVPKFLEFQYGDNLNENSTVHRGIIENIKKYNLLEYLPKININQTLNKGLAKPLQRIKDKDKAKDIDKAKAKDNAVPEFIEFLEYTKTLEIYSSELDYHIKAKYNSWVENGWKDGNDKKIKNWKTKIQNTLPYLRKDSNGKGTSSKRSSNFVSREEFESELKQAYDA